MCSTLDRASIASSPGKFCPRSIALIAARDSCQGESLVLSATSAWVIRNDSRVDLKKVPTET